MSAVLHQPITIPSEADGLSDVIELTGRVLVGIEMPADWDAADLTLQACSTETGTFQNVHEADDSEHVISAAADRWITLDPDLYRSLRFIKLRSGTSAVPVEQTVARTLTIATACVGYA